jgi:hypothetical protein
MYRVPWVVSLLVCPSECHHVASFVFLQAGRYLAHPHLIKGKMERDKPTLHSLSSEE